MNDKILFVDDDPNLLAGFQRTLRKEFSLDTAAGPREALEALQKTGPYAVIVADMRMPGMDGLKLLEFVRKISPDTVRVMLTGNAEQQIAVHAVNRGQIFRFLNKPCPTETLVPTVQAALQQYQLVRAERELLEGTVTQCVHTLSEMLGLTVPEAHSRGQLLRERMHEFATAAEVGPLWELEIGALLSHIGFASVPPNVLRKVAARVPLSLEENAMIRRVPQTGHDLIAGIPRLENVARIILYQQKNFDGSGPPHDMCSGEDLPVGARMLKIMVDRLAHESEAIGSSVRSAMLEQTSVYDTRLLELCFRCFPVSLGRPHGAGRPPRAMCISELATGLRLYADIRTPGGLTVATAGQPVTPLLIQRLRNLAEIGEVQEPILIHDELGVALPPRAPAPATSEIKP